MKTTKEITIQDYIWMAEQKLAELEFRINPKNIATVCEIIDKEFHIDKDEVNQWVKKMKKENERYRKDIENKIKLAKLLHKKSL